MAQYEDKVLHELDGIKEYDNPMPGWLMAIWWGSLIFAGGLPDLLRAQLRRRHDGGRVPRQQTAADGDHRPGLLRRPPAGAADARRAAGRRHGTPRCSTLGAARFARSCAPCHGEQAQGLIGPNLTDDRWIHGGSVEQIFQTVAKGWPAKGMPPWGRALKPEELAALVSYVRSLQGSNPPNARAAEGEPFAPEPIPGS